MRNRIPPSKRRKPQTDEERIAFVAMFATAMNKHRGLTPEANCLDVHLQFQRAIDEDPAHTAIETTEVDGEKTEWAHVAGCFLEFMKRLNIDHRDPYSQERWSRIVDQAITDCLNDPECAARQRGAVDG